MSVLPPHGQEQVSGGPPGGHAQLPRRRFANVTTADRIQPKTFTTCFKCGGTVFWSYGFRRYVRRFECRSCGVTRSDNGCSPGMKRPQSDRRKVERMYVAGDSIPVIARATNISGMSVWAWPHQAGITMRSRVRKPGVKTSPNRCAICGGEVLIDNNYRICVDCGKSNRPNNL